MEDRQTILEELAEISPVVAAIGASPTYRVPGGYFDQFPFAVVMKIALDEKSGADPTVPGNGLLPYQAPEGYFDQFSDTLMQRIQAEAAAEAAVPDPELTVLAQINRQHPYTPPPGYFEEFSVNVMAGVKALDMVNEQLENLSPALSSVQQKQVYTVPDGYFDHFPSLILEKAGAAGKTPVITLASRRTGFRKYAAAAAVAGIIALGAYLFSAGKNQNALASAGSKSLVDTAALAAIPDPEIENFLSINTIALAEIAADSTSMAKLSPAPDDPRDLLADISDEALESYMDQRPATPLSN